MEHSKPHPAFKVWMETDDGYVFGPGVYSLLKRIMEVGTLKEAATELGMSYRYAWGLIKKAEEKLGEPLLTAHKGGRSGGGGAELTERGKQFLVEFQKLREKIIRVTQTIPQQLINGVVKEIKFYPDQTEVVIRINVLDKTRLKKGENVSIYKM
jgi:molybdate transport repressor ModE-like protein